LPDRDVDLGDVNVEGKTIYYQKNRLTGRIEVTGRGITTLIGRHRDWRTQARVDGVLGNELSFRSRRIMSRASLIVTTAPTREGDVQCSRPFLPAC
jgi:hypothetical protein